MFQGFFSKTWQKYVYNVVTRCKIQEHCTVAIYNQWDISAALSRRTSEKGWHIFSVSSLYDLDTQGDFYPELYIPF